MISILIVSGFLLAACSDDSNDSDAFDNASDSVNDSEDQKVSANIPEEVIKDADADPIELEDQMDLEIGDKGYAITQSEGLPLAATLNSVEKTQDVGSETRDGDKFYLIADFTFENLGDGHLEVEKPDVGSSSDESAIINDEVTKGDRLGLGSWALDENGDIDQDNPTNTITLEPGEEANHKIALSMLDSADEYIVYFGFYASNNRDYRNKAAWTIQTEQIDEK